MIKLKDQKDIDLYTYKVCQVSSCTKEAVKVFMVQAKEINLCAHHHEDVENMSYLS